MRRMGLGRSGGWWGLAAGIVLLGILEAAVLHFLARALLPHPAALVVDVVAGSLTLLLVAAFLSPLWGSYRLTPRVLRLRFGWLAAVDIPLSAIADIRPHRADPRRPAELGLDFDHDSGLLSVIRSPSAPLVRIELNTEVEARTQGWKRVRARAILASADNADSLCEAVTEARNRP
ncbi:hypothetical protein H0264_15275 [Nocardia huaxiensis]|uniref:PH (Pleckstrin Homology) domain-containing protein n=1 Tax=Nocardia huaxiensis TaxID=2755382 RepID=A0A7D6ZLC0_9NOCA|nr:hypothetical protein [Nocardia huaxiensis]QLY33407.1 hypothetical protein H0264_15275 [Nocardia huaxiensis]